MRKPCQSAVFLLLALSSIVLSGQDAKVRQPVSADFVSPGPVAPLAEPVMAAASGIRAGALAAHIAFLASPSMEGRGLGARGLEASAEYVAASLTLAGVPPLGPGSTAGASDAYFQPVPLREISRPSGQVTIETRRGDAFDQRAFLSGVDCLFAEVRPEVFSAPVVFAGFGIREASPARDDYRDLDVKDRIVLIFGGLPSGAEWQKPEMAERYGAESGRQRYAAKLEVAASLGARAVLAIEGDDFAARLSSGDDAQAATYFLPFDDPGAQSPPLVRLSPRAAEAAFSAAGLTAASARASRPRALPGVAAIVRANGDERLVFSRNVVGVIRGTDPKLSDKAVVMGAHMDHLGRTGETIYPGADDNASGVAALLEIARAFAASPVKPKRTLVFAFWTGEEEGKLGSGHYVRHPLWPLERTPVYLNLDMIAHPWSMDEIRKLVADTGLANGAEFLAKVKPAEFIELGVADWAPDLGAFLVQAARANGLALHLDRTDGKNGGSDYRDFARKNLPFVRFFGNFFDGYHEPTDSADKLDAGQVQRMARLAFVSAWLMADR
jgi:hypothetical protein